MIKTLLSFFLLTALRCTSEKQQISLEQDHYFIRISGVITKLHKSNDTLYNYNCYPNGSCYDAQYLDHYKIISLRQKEEFAILKMEKLDTLQMTTMPYPETRYCIYALKNISDNELGYLPLRFGLTKKQIDSLEVNTDTLKNKFFYTYFSDMYYKSLFSLKKITTKQDVEEVIAEVKKPVYEGLAKTYMQTNVFDMYASGISAELLNRACIARGFNPVGASQIINKLMKEEK